MLKPGRRAMKWRGKYTCLVLHGGKKKKLILLLAWRSVPNILQKCLTILSSCIRAVVRVSQWTKTHDCLACDICFSLMALIWSAGKKRTNWQADTWEGSQSSLVTVKFSVQWIPSPSPGKWNILFRTLFCQIIPTSKTIGSVGFSLGMFLLWSSWVAFPVYRVWAKTSNFVFLHKHMFSETSFCLIF